MFFTIFSHLCVVRSDGEIWIDAIDGSLSFGECFTTGLMMVVKCNCVAGKERPFAWLSFFVIFSAIANQLNGNLIWRSFLGTRVCREFGNRCNMFCWIKRSTYLFSWYVYVIEDCSTTRNSRKWIILLLVVNVLIKFRCSPNKMELSKWVNLGYLSRTVYRGKCYYLYIWATFYRSYSDIYLIEEDKVLILWYSRHSGCPMFHGVTAMNSEWT